MKDLINKIPKLPLITSIFSFFTSIFGLLFSGFFLFVIIFIIIIIVIILMIMLLFNFQIPFFLTKTNNYYNFPTISSKIVVENTQKKDNGTFSVKAKNNYFHKILDDKIILDSGIQDKSNDIENEVYFYNDVTSNMAFYENFYTKFFKNYFYFSSDYLKNLNPVIKNGQVFDKENKNLNVYVDLIKEKVNSNLIISKFDYFYEKVFKNYDIKKQNGNLTGKNIPKFDLTLKISDKKNYSLIKNDNPDINYITFPIKIKGFGSEIKKFDYLEKENNNNNSLMKSNVHFYLKTENIKLALGRYIREKLNKSYYNNFLKKYCENVDNKKLKNINFFNYLYKNNGKIIPSNKNKIDIFKDFHKNYACGIKNNEKGGKNTQKILRKITTDFTKKEKGRYEAMIRLLKNFNKMKLKNVNNNPNKKKLTFSTDNPYYIIQNKNKIQLNPQLQLMSLSLLDNKKYNLKDKDIIFGTGKQDGLADKSFKQKEKNKTVIRGQSFVDFLNYFKKNNNKQYEDIFIESLNNSINNIKENDIDELLYLTEDGDKQDKIKKENYKNLFSIAYNNYYIKNLNGYQNYLKNTLGIKYTPLISKIKGKNYNDFVVHLNGEKKYNYILNGKNQYKKYLKYFRDTTEKEQGWFENLGLNFDSLFSKMKIQILNQQKIGNSVKYFNTLGDTNNIQNFDLISNKFLKEDYVQTDGQNTRGLLTDLNNYQVFLFKKYFYEKYKDKSKDEIKVDEEFIKNIKEFNKILLRVNNYVYLRHLYNNYIESNTLGNNNTAILYTEFKNIFDNLKSDLNKETNKMLSNIMQNIKNNNYDDINWEAIFRFYNAYYNKELEKIPDVKNLIEKDLNQLSKNDNKKLLDIQYKLNFKDNNSFFMMPNYEEGFFNQMLLYSSYIFGNAFEKDKSYENFNTMTFKMNSLKIKKDYNELQIGNRNALEYSKYFIENEKIGKQYDELIDLITYKVEEKTEIEQKVKIKKYKKIVDGIVKKMAKKSNILFKNLIEVDENGTVKEYSYCKKIIKNTDSKSYSNCVKFFNDYIKIAGTKDYNSYFKFYQNHIKPVELQTFAVDMKGNLKKGVFWNDWKEDAKYCGNNHSYNGECVCMVRIRYDFPEKNGKIPGGNAKKWCGSYENYIDNGGKGNVYYNVTSASNNIRKGGILVGGGGKFGHIGVITEVNKKTVTVEHFNYCNSSNYLYDAYDEIVKQQQIDYKESGLPCQWVYKQTKIPKATLEYGSQKLNFQCLIQPPRNYLREN